MAGCNCTGACRPGGGCRGRANFDYDDFPVILGQGSLHDLRDADADPRNPRLTGFKSVSRAGAIGLAKAPPQQSQRAAGFYPRGRR